MISISSVDQLVETNRRGLWDIRHDGPNRIMVTKHPPNTYLIISDDIEERNDVRTTRKVLKDLDFSLNLLLLDRLQNLDHAFLIVDDVDTLKNFRVLAAA